MTGWKPLYLTLVIRKDPKAVRAWWTELPDDYVAKDPKEQPFRIVTLEHHEDGRTVETHWRTPFGVQKSVERLRLHADGSWSFGIARAMFGVQVHDDYRTTATPEGTRLHIRSTFTPRTMAHRVLAPLLAPMMRAVFRSTFTTAARICERDAV